MRELKLKELISAIEQKHKQDGFEANPPATQQQIDHFHLKLGFSLPDDFVAFYKICNGFECGEDIFVMKSLEVILERADAYSCKWFYFSDYMINSDLWSLRINQDGHYEIGNFGDSEIILTSSLNEFLEHFLEGNVFDKGGLYDWQAKLKASHKLKVKDLRDVNDALIEPQIRVETRKRTLSNLNFQDKLKIWFQRLFNSK